MSELLDRAIQRSIQCDIVFCKFLSANDTGLTGGHQCGIYVQKQCVPLIFDGLFERGSNHDRWADIVWNEEFKTHSRFIYYGAGTRNEYRITNFGRGFPLLRPEHTGDLVVICKESDSHYWAYVLSTEQDIEDYLSYWDVLPTELNVLLKAEKRDPGILEASVFNRLIMEYGDAFPDTKAMAQSAEEADRLISGETVLQDPDTTIIRWVEAEYRLFRQVEETYYSYVLESPMSSLDEFVKTGLEITNRRKSRAGKSLEHHLASVFRGFGLPFTEQAITEGKKKPDFLFPSDAAYHDLSYPSESLVFLGSKTTCKDRWRQVLNEADRIPHKYLFTLQQGVSPMQLDEMRAENLTLVVPRQLHKAYPKGGDIITLREFIEIVQTITC